MELWAMFAAKHKHEKMQTNVLGVVEKLLF